MDTFVAFQLLDSALPVGSFAHSQGLEAAVHCGLVSDVESLEGFAATHARAAALLVGPFVRECAALGRGDWGPQEISRAVAMSNQLDTLLLGVPDNRHASLLTGQALLRLGMQGFGYGELRRVAAAAGFQAHHGISLGLICACAGVPPPLAVRIFLFSGTRDVLSAATRLDVLGPTAASRLLSHLGRFLQTLAEEVNHTPLSHARSTSPWLDILQSSHGRLRFHLFRS